MHCHAPNVLLVLRSLCPCPLHPESNHPCYQHYLFPWEVPIQPSGLCSNITCPQSPPLAQKPHSKSLEHCGLRGFLWIVVPNMLFLKNNNNSHQRITWPRA